MSRAIPAKDDNRCISPGALEKLRSVIIGLFSEGQFHEVGFRTICSQAKVSPKTVYKYFGNKEQLLAACVEQDLQELLDQSRVGLDAAAATAEQFRNQIRVLFSFYQARPEIARMIFLNIPVAYWLSRHSPAHSAHRELIRGLLAQAQQRGELRAGLDVNDVSELVAGGLNRLICQWLTQSDWQLTDRVDSCSDFYLAAVRA